MGAYEVVATFWEEPCPQAPTGYIRHLRGSVIDVPAEHLDRLLRIGAITPAGGGPGTDADADTGSASDAVGDDSAESVAGDAESAPPGAAVERPKQAAAKAVWVEYAVARGMDRNEAEVLDKRELIAALD